MLVLSRKASETITIGDDISIEIRRIAGNRVTVAINAPRDVRILRGELAPAAEAFEETPAESNKAESPYVVTHHRVPIATGLPVTSETANVVG